MSKEGEEEEGQRRGKRGGGRKTINSSSDTI